MVDKYGYPTKEEQTSFKKEVEEKILRITRASELEGIYTYVGYDDIPPSINFEISEGQIAYTPAMLTQLEKELGGPLSFELINNSSGSGYSYMEWGVLDFTINFEEKE